MKLEEDATWIIFDQRNKHIEFGATNHENDTILDIDSNIDVYNEEVFFAITCITLKAMWMGIRPWTK